MCFSNMHETVLLDMNCALYQIHYYYYYVLSTLTFFFNENEKRFSCLSIIAHLSQTEELLSA